MSPLAGCCPGQHSSSPLAACHCSDTTLGVPSVSCGSCYQQRIINIPLLLQLYSQLRESIILIVMSALTVEYRPVNNATGNIKMHWKNKLGHNNNDIQSTIMHPNTLNMYNIFNRHNVYNYSVSVT